jgi:serine protease AprX
MLKMQKDGPDTIQYVIIDVNLRYTEGRKAARELIGKWIEELLGDNSPDEYVDHAKSKYSQQYIFAQLSGHHILALLRRDEAECKKQYSVYTKPEPALHRIWLDHEVEKFCNVSISTVKADAVRNAFGPLGKDIVWAVIDTGIKGDHPHFEKHGNLKLELPLRHRDFTQLGKVDDDDELARRALTDEDGHGTHVAGIIAGEFEQTDTDVIRAAVRKVRPKGIPEGVPEGLPELLRGGELEDVRETLRDIGKISGMAPDCKLLSLKAVSKANGSRTSSLIAAIEYIQELNGYGRDIKVHGVNLSVGYDFKPKWFACGQSPLCVEVDRLTRSGVVVVVAAGNTGYGDNAVLGSGPSAAGLDVTINDPGNAELAITVGSTHREMPHVYGVSYFSSKGPTGDGRLKPDLVAPGEKIISCAITTPPAGDDDPEAAGKRVVSYRADSGTSMAAPHVSGVIAAFLSLRREFIARPERVKEVFMSAATDLRRTAHFQGKGLVDLMRAIQSV